MSDLELIRHDLGLVDLSEIEEEEQSTSERRAYCAAIFAVLPRLEEDIKKFLYSQLLFNAKESMSWEQVLVGRGALDGPIQLLEKWRLAAQEHVESSTKPEEFDKHAPTGDV